MNEIPQFWDIGPHDYLHVEGTFHEFVRSVGGQIVSESLPRSPDFENADYFFEAPRVVGELKVVETEFLNSESSKKKLGHLLEKLMEENPNWRPLLFGGSTGYPDWFNVDLIRIARPAISRILKKANRQIRETKQRLNVSGAQGILFFVNDGFTGLAPNTVIDLVCGALYDSYSSIDCFIYLSVNRYIEIQGSNEPKLIWVPSYSDRATDQLVDFVDNLGRRWFDFLELKIGELSPRIELEGREILLGSKPITAPGKRGKE